MNYSIQIWRKQTLLSPKITILNLGNILADLTDWFSLPSNHPYAGQVEKVPMFCYHISLPGRSVLVDAAAYQFTTTENAKEVPPNSSSHSLIGQLTAAKINPEGINDVIITHAHSDHYSGLTCLVNNCYQPAFPNARHYLGSGDWQPENFEELENQTLTVVQQHGLLNLVDGELDLGDGLKILPAPGETPGHQILLLKSGKLELYFVGDLYHHPLEFIEPERNGYWAEPESMQASKELFTEIAARSGGPVYLSHLEKPYRVERVGNEVHWSEV